MYNLDDELFFCESLRYHTCSFSASRRLAAKQNCEIKYEIPIPDTKVGPKTGPKSSKDIKEEQSVKKKKKKSATTIKIPMADLYPIVKKMMFSDPDVSIKSLFAVCSIVFGIEDVCVDLHMEQIRTVVTKLKRTSTTTLFRKCR